MKVVARKVVNGAGLRMHLSGLHAQYLGDVKRVTPALYEFHDELHALADAGTPAHGEIPHTHEG